MALNCATNSSTSTSRSTSTSTISVLRVGGPSPDVTLLLTNALLHFFYEYQSDDKGHDDNDDTDDTEDDAEKPEDPIQPLVVKLQNKYFSASILLSELLHDLSANVDNPSQQYYSHYAYKEDGIVLVFDALKCNPDLDNQISFDSLDYLHNHQHHHQHNPHSSSSSSSSSSSATDTCFGDLLRLCVGVSLGQHTPQELRGKDHEKEYTKRVLWCLDRGYEYVEVDLSQAGQGTGHDDRDKEGFARVIEAIQGTVWSSAVMKARKERVQVSEAAEETKESADAVHEKEENTRYEPPDPETIGRFLQVPEPTDDYLDEPKTQEESVVRAAHEQDAKAFQELEALMKEATRIRDMSRNGDISDDDVRRTRAAEAATLMMGLMERMGIDDTDDEDSDD